MKQIAMLIAAGFVLVACVHNSDGEITATSDDLINGETAFLENCAGCHETGIEGAPRLGEPGDWQSRSNLWQAVLMEHAKSGYFDMPARGGKTELPNEVVEAATEYMLEQTFTDRPED